MAARKSMAKVADKPKVEETLKVEETQKVEAEPKAKAKSVAVAKKKQYKDDDKISCFSITTGEYLYVGDKSGDLYTWLTDGDVVDVRCDDLVAAIRTRKAAIFKPRFIIQDEEFVAQYPNVKRIYDALYSPEDLKRILELPADRLASVINGLPDGAKESLKFMAVKAIDDGSLDSVARVRVLDQIYGTDMLLRLAN